MEKSMQKYMVLPLRVVQLFSIACVITGFIWASSDYLLLTVLATAPVTPISVLLMLYGTLGIFSSEGVIRLICKKKAVVVEKKWLASAWLMALLLAVVIFVPAIAIVGVSELGEMAIGSEGTLTHVANTTLWNTMASIGLPWERYRALRDLDFAYKCFVVEPILDFDVGELFSWIYTIPQVKLVAVGYDNYDNRLPEPSLEKTQEFLSRLRGIKGLAVYEKTLREAWWEQSEV